MIFNMFNRIQFTKKTFFILAITAICVSVLPAHAQDNANRSYHYSSINTAITVRPDTTFDVVETQTYSFQGNYHVGWRSIALKGTDGISNISVIDSETGQPLIYSNKRLNKLDPTSWGKFTTFTEKGAQDIEWYYDLADTTHEWQLNYTVHGGISFLKTADRLYWNIFTDYDVPVDQASVTVKLPGEVTANATSFTAFRNAEIPIQKTLLPNNTTFTFDSNNFIPSEDFTIDVSWSQGLINRSAYWRDFVKQYYGYTIGGLLALLSLIIGILRWLFTEKFPKGKGTIIAQYEPPQNLRPAVAQIICKEALHDSGMTATIVDLAVRGYVTIDEEERTGLLAKFMGKNYKIMPAKEYAEDAKVETYEKEYMDILFGSRGYFSTSEIKTDRAAARVMLAKIQALKERIIKETETRTGAYAHPLSREKYKVLIWILLIICFPIARFALHVPAQSLGIIIGVETIIALLAFIKFEARLSYEGRVLKEELLGFKLYLEVAERYRMQNLTPETFEKYLPYAMIFGVEKKWAQNFETIYTQPPEWYHSPALAAGAANFSAGSFSAIGFSSSFSSSFSSAFASSAGGGGAAGGGAGGGGGGGGGGAG